MKIASFMVLVVSGTLVWACKGARSRTENSLPMDVPQSLGVNSELSEVELEALSLLLAEVQIVDIKATLIVPKVDDSLALTGGAKVASGVAEVGGSQVKQLSKAIGEDIGAAMKRQADDVSATLQAKANKSNQVVKYTDHELQSIAKELYTISDKLKPGTRRANISVDLASNSKLSKFEVQDLRAQKNGHSLLVLREKEDETLLFIMRNPDGNMSVLRPDNDLIRLDQNVGFEAHLAPGGGIITAAINSVKRADLEDLFAGEGAYAKFSSVLFGAKRRELNFWTVFLRKNANDIDLLKDLEAIQVARGANNSFAISDADVLAVIEKNYHTLPDPVKNMVHEVSRLNNDNLISKMFLNLRDQGIDKKVIDFADYEDFRVASQQWASEAKSVNIEAPANDRVHRDILFHNSIEKRINLYEQATPEQTARYFSELRQNVQDELGAKLLGVPDKNINPDTLDELTYIAHLIDKGELSISLGSGGSTSSIMGVKALVNELTKGKNGSFLNKLEFETKLKSIAQNYPITHKPKREIAGTIEARKLAIEPAAIFSGLAIKGQPPPEMTPQWTSEQMSGMRIIKGNAPKMDKISIKAINVGQTNSLGKPVTAEMHYRFQNAGQFLDKVEASRYPFLDFYLKADPMALNDAKFIAAIDRETRQVYMLRGGNIDFAEAETLAAEQMVLRSVGRSNFETFGAKVDRPKLNVSG